ncbi:MAG: hypothetical protein KC584_13370, partial [Nitrospira sp.]|nr:hypothetical protein [Nitrospira sp.]
MRFPGLNHGVQVFLLSMLGIGCVWTASAVVANASATQDFVEPRPHVKDLGITIGRYASGEM